MDGLNHDILRKIFIDFDAEHHCPCDVPVVSAVCKKWRAVALHTPELWTKICACAFEPHDQQHTRIRLARDKGLEVTFSVHSPSLADALEFAILSVEKMSSLSIIIREADIYKHELYPQRAIENYINLLEDIDSLSSRKLKHFALEWNVGGIDDDLAPSIYLPILDVPDLNSLCIDGVTLAFNDTQVFGSLTVLCLRHLRTVSSVGTTDIAALASRCMNLRCLTLDCALDRSRSRHTPPSNLVNLRFLLIRDDASKIAVFTGTVTCPKIKYVRIRIISPHDEDGVEIGRAVAMIMRSQLLSVLSPLKFARRLAVTYTDLSHLSVGWSPSKESSSIYIWDGLSYDDIRPKSLDAERDRLMQGIACYESTIHIVSDLPTNRPHNSGILCAEHVIRQFTICQRSPKLLDSFCARGISFALAEYMSGVHATSVIIDQSNYPLHNWLAAIPRHVTSRAALIHISRAYLVDDIAYALQDLQQFTSVSVSDCRKHGKNRSTGRFHL